MLAGWNLQSTPRLSGKAGSTANYLCVHNAAKVAISSSVSSKSKRSISSAQYSERLGGGGGKGTEMGRERGRLKDRTQGHARGARRVRCGMQAAGRPGLSAAVTIEMFCCTNHRRPTYNPRQHPKGRVGPRSARRVESPQLKSANGRRPQQIATN